MAVKIHKLVGGYQLRDAVLFCNCGLINCIRIPGGDQTCDLLGPLAKREDTQAWAVRAVDDLRKLFEHGAEWLSRDRAVALAAGVPMLDAVNAARTLLGWPRVETIEEHAKDVEERSVDLSGER